MNIVRSDCNNYNVATFIIRQSLLLDDRYGSATSLFITASNLFIFDSTTNCSLVMYIVGN